MKRFITALLIAALPAIADAQSYPHVTMFMFNKLIYNPAYAGNKNMTSINALYRSQWTGIDGAPKNFNIGIDGPIGNYMKPFRSVALGLSINNEKVGVVNNTNIMAYYAYRIPLEKSVISFGLQAGASLYSAEYSKLNPYDPNDPTLTNNGQAEDIKARFLPNFGLGIYYSGENYYASFAIPNIAQNYYDKDHNDTITARQVRSYYLGAGYVFPVAENVKLEPQILARYAGNGDYSLPMNADFNLSAILYDRFMIGATYRTDKSLEGIVHMQVTNNINIGYSYDWTVSDLNKYANGSHEVTIGYDFVRDNNKYVNPRFIKPF